MVELRFLNPAAGWARERVWKWGDEEEKKRDRLRTGAGRRE
jgi:hypothetical protein